MRVTGQSPGTLAVSPPVVKSENFISHDVMIRCRGNWQGDRPGPSLAPRVRTGKISGFFRASGSDLAHTGKHAPSAWSNRDMSTQKPAMSRRRQRTFRARFERLEDRSLLSSLTPAQVRHAYGVDAIVFSAGGQTVKGTGAGQTIAVIVADHNPYLSAEVHAFDAANGLPDPVLTQVNLAGGQIDDGWAQEEALDVEWAHAIAPGASFLVVEAASDRVSDLMVGRELRPPVARRVRRVDELGGRGVPGPGQLRPLLHHAGRPQRGHLRDRQRGLGRRVRSGVAGVVPERRGGRRNLTPRGRRWQRAVARWPGPTAEAVLSRVVSRPAYQAFVQRSGKRTTPDICDGGRSRHGRCRLHDRPVNRPGLLASPVGGTSLSAQLFGGLVAIANQGRALRGAGTLDGPSETLPALYALPSSAYRDVTRGWTGFRASPGYDLATGRGTPTAALVTDLANGSIPANFGARPARTNSHRKPVKSVVRRRDHSASDHRAGAERVPLAEPSRSFGAPWALASPRMRSPLSENPRAGHSSRRR